MIPMVINQPLNSLIICPRAGTGELPKVREPMVLPNNWPRYSKDLSVVTTSNGNAKALDGVAKIKNAYK